MVSSNTKAKIRILILALVCFLSFKAEAGSIRTVGVSSDSMTPIYLKLGKSTVLRFTDKPRKVVVGNQNYYGLEFIENDLAIQPLGGIATNLFVYTESRTYGFLLTPGERYDDLVFVRWRSPVPNIDTRGETPPTTKEFRPGLSFKIGKTFKVSIDTVKIQPSLGVHLIDCTVENVGNVDLLLSRLTLQAMRLGAKLEKQETVFEKEILKTKEKSKIRLVLKLDQKSDFTIEGKFGNDSGKTVLARKFL